MNLILIALFLYDCLITINAHDWIGIAIEEVGGGNGIQYDNSDLRTLGFSDLPSFVFSGNYMVRLEWYDQYMQFIVPSGHDIFSQKGDIIIQSVQTSVILPRYGDNAIFCHACIKNSNQKPGDTCWAVLPSTDGYRICGCNSPRWFGEGIYYGGYKNPTVCGGQGGGFSGPKTNGQRKGNLGSIGLVLKIKAIDMQKIHNWTEGKLLSCPKLGCETLSGGEMQCLEKCTANLNCNGINFCPPDADCPIIGWCCMFKCQADNFLSVTWEGYNI